MRLDGLKINFLGDSITEGCGTSNMEKVYWNILKNEYGLSKARGYGVGGTKIARRTTNTPSVSERWDLDFLMRCPEMDDDADVVVIFGGTNDYGNGDAPMGSFSDRTPYTFYGACHLLCETLIKKYPNSIIIWMTPIHREGDGNARPGFEPLLTYVNVIKEIGSHYCMPVLDLWSLLGIQPNDADNKKKYCPDGLHPNDEGHRLIASALAEFLAKL